MASQNPLIQSLPWIQSPLIANAPMAGSATGKLAIAVSRAGGLGQIAFLDDLETLSEHLQMAQKELKDIMATLPNPEVLPIGMGVIVFYSHSRLDTWLQLIAKYKPAVVWISFGSTEEFQVWIEGIRRVSPDTKVWVQLGSVSAALGVVKLPIRPDALVLQGSDAGGHGPEYGASIVSLIPEVADALRERGIVDVPLVAAGGIVDGRGSAAALALGASGVVMGTRFLAATETVVPDFYREALFNATDGGQATVRSHVFDETRGPNMWPTTYDGRCLRNKVYEKYKSGEDSEKIRTWLQHNQESLAVQDVRSIWAGTGVGLVKQTASAADIVQEVRNETRRRLNLASSFV